MAGVMIGTIMCILGLYSLIKGKHRCTRGTNKIK